MISCNMILRNVLATLIFLTLCPNLCDGHGRMMDPPARNSMWRLGFNNPVNYNDNELYCGGRMVQWIRNKGKCGLCGDAYHGNQEHEAGGKYANGVIGKSYHAGDTIPIVVHLTANHQGWFEFKLCPVNDPKKKVTQKCFDENVLQRADGRGTTFPIPQGKYNAFFNFSVKLPNKLTCKQCVMQWKYRTGNTWDKDDNSGVFCLGCGPQEEFYNCADVEILPKGQKSDWIKETIPTTTVDNGITTTPTIHHSTTKRRMIVSRTTTQPSKKHMTKYKLRKITTTATPSARNKYKQKIHKGILRKEDKTSSETYLIEPKLSETRRWRAGAARRNTSKRPKKTPNQFFKNKSRSPFKKPKITKLPSWLINTRRIQESRRKLIARRQLVLRRKELIRKQKAYRRQQELRRLRVIQPASTTIRTTVPTTSRPTTTVPTTSRPRTTVRSSKPLLAHQKNKHVQTPPCSTNHASEKNSMVASTDMPDNPVIAIRERISKTQYVTAAPTHRAPVYITRRPMAKPDYSRYGSSQVNMQHKIVTNRPRYPVEYPEHPVIETEEQVLSSVHRHSLPFHSRSPFANPRNSHVNPLIHYWWNQYQRPIVNLWNNVRPVLKCHGTITLGGGMDEWCTANCNANFCPGGMCVCQPQTSVYPTYSVYPSESQSWMNSFTPGVHMDTPRPITVRNPYIIHRKQQQQLEAYKRRAIQQQQMSPIYAAHNTVQRSAINEESGEQLIQQYAPALSTNVTNKPRPTNQIAPDTKQIIHKRSTYEPPSSLPSLSTATTPMQTTTEQSTQISSTTEAPTTIAVTTNANWKGTPILVQTNLAPFKAYEQSDRYPKRTSKAWLINTHKTHKTSIPSIFQRQTLDPKLGYKASPSSENEVSKVQARAKRLKSKAQFWRRRRNIKCHATGKYSGLKRFDDWCSQNCMQTICPLLICQCERY